MPSIAAAFGGIEELVELHRIRNHPDPRRCHAHLFELLSLGMGDGKQPVCPSHHPATEHQVEGAFGEATGVDVRCGAVGGEYVRYAGSMQIVRCERAGNVPARMKMRHVERRRVLSQERGESDRQKALIPVSEPVRHISEHMRLDNTLGPRPADATAGAALTREAVLRIASIRRADGHSVAPIREPPRNGSRDPRYTAIRPRIGRVRHHVKHAHPVHGNTKLPHMLEIRTSLGGGAPETLVTMQTRGTRASRASNWAGLAWTLVRTDFRTRYHGTTSGFAWALLKPMGIFLVLMSVFSFVFPDPRYKYQLIVGLFLWDFFAEGTKVGLGSLHAKAFLFSKIRVPLWIVVVTSIANPLITLTVFGVGLLLLLSLSGQSPSAAGVALFATYCLSLTLLVVGFSLATSVLFLKYRDLNQVWDVITQAGFFVAPIIYPLGIIPERLHFLFYGWPPTPIIEFSRSVLIAHTAPSLTAHVYLAAEALTSLAIGAAVLKRFGPRAAEWL